MPPILALHVAALLVGADLQTGALDLSWSDDGRIQHLRVADREVTGVGVAASGFALRDAAVEADYEPVSGTLRQAQNALHFAGRNAAGTLAVAADLRAEADGLVVSGEVANLDGGEHAVSLRFGLPVACDAWRWDTRLHKSEPLAGRVVHLGVPSPLGSGYLALGPVAAIHDAQSTLGLAVPMSLIAQYDFVADGPAGLFAVVLDFAMTGACPPFHQRVPFELYLAAEPDGWGLRSVLARYYANHPEWFERHLPDAGGWFAWGDILRQPPPLSDYGLKFHEQPESADGYEHDVALGIKVYPYIEPSMYQMCLGDHQERPEREAILARLEEWAKPETTGRLPSGGFPTQESLQRICEGILKSGLRDRDGQVVIGSVGQYPWISGSHWAAQFPLNLSPEIEGGAGQARLAEALGLLRQPHVDGIYLDSLSGHLTRINYAADQFATLSYPPQFDAQTKQPCLLNGMTMMAWVEALWSSLPPESRTLLPNLYNQPCPFPWPRLSVLGKEHWVEPAGPLMQQFRVMGYRKVVTQLPSYEDVDERFLRNLLLLDVFPGGYARRETDPPQGMRAAYRQVTPLLRRLDQLGWHPVTQAVATTPGTRVERYGAPPGRIALAVHNPYAGQVCRVDVDAAALGLPADAWPVEVLDQAHVEYRRDGDRLLVALGVDGNSTNLLVLGDATAHAAWSRGLAEDKLGDVRLCLAEYALRRDDVAAHPAAERAAALTAGSAPDALAATTAAVTGDSPEETRARELLAEAADLLRATPQPVPSQTAVAPPPASTVKLPWTEPFDELSPDRWRVAALQPGVRLNDGRLELELPRDRRSADLSGVVGFPFVPDPIVIETDFKYTHGPHDRYLMMGLWLYPTTEGGNEFLLVRIEGHHPGVVRVENQEAPATDWKTTLTDWTRFDSDAPHHLRLRLDATDYKLEIDDQLVGEGPHGCEFGWAYLRLGVYSGHMGQGDVCWWDNLAVRRVE